jgi:hypothetical protein
MRNESNQMVVQSSGGPQLRKALERLFEIVHDGLQHGYGLKFRAPS